LVVCALSAVAGVVLLAPASASGQNRDAAADQWTLPRTGDGRPDLQGVWDFRSRVNLSEDTRNASKPAYYKGKPAMMVLAGIG